MSRRPRADKAVERRAAIVIITLWLIFSVLFTVVNIA